MFLNYFQNLINARILDSLKETFIRTISIFKYYETPLTFFIETSIYLSENTNNFVRLYFSKEPRLKPVSDMYLVTPLVWSMPSILLFKYLYIHSCNSMQGVKNRSMSNQNIARNRKFSPGIPLTIFFYCGYALSHNQYAGVLI